MHTVALHLFVGTDPAKPKEQVRTRKITPMIMTKVEVAGRGVQGVQEVADTLSSGHELDLYSTPIVATACQNVRIMMYM